MDNHNYIQGDFSMGFVRKFSKNAKLNMPMMLFFKNGIYVARLYWHQGAQQLALETDCAITRPTMLFIMSWMRLDRWRLARRFHENKCHRQGVHPYRTKNKAVWCTMGFETDER